VQHGVGAPDEGKSWMQMRKISAQVFNRKNFNTLMQDVFVEKAQDLCNYLGQTQGKAIDLQTCFFDFTMDSAMRIFFGEDSSITKTGQPSKYGKAFDDAQLAFIRHAVPMVGIYSLLKVFVPWPLGGPNGKLRKLFDWSSSNYRHFRSAMRILDRESSRLIRECRADPKLQQRRDLLALFIQAEEGKGWSTRFLQDMSLNLIIAARDTTACALSWMFWELARNPEIQAKLCAEIDEKMPKGKPLDTKALGASQMPYLNGVFYETLRLWPPVPQDSKIAFSDDVLPDGTKVPKNTMLLFMPYVIGRDPQLYKDPLVFRPERWIPFEQPPPHEFPVFQAGPRICLGMDMAIFEAKIVAVELLRKFHFDLVPGQEITYGQKITMNIRNGDKEELLMTVQPR